MVQRDRQDRVLLVHNVSDVTVHDDVIAADGGEHPRMTSSNVTERNLQRPTRVNLVYTLLCVEHRVHYLCNSVTFSSSSSSSSNKKFSKATKKTSAFAMHLPLARLVSMTVVSPANIRINFILLETVIPGLHFCR